ncbi:DUF6284 family protein [Actinoplanes sp. HUAS TT8]|uniref:DUF6284 family protein n=1 Tax=Actinoplanes sp. HUAS TT8 TaxID=3447453 RepID=UPI003F526ECD
MRDHDYDYDAEPPVADLAAIEDAEPLIAAEFEWAVAEVALLAAASRGRATVLDVRRVRRAEHAVIRETFAHVARMARPVAPRRAA